MRRMRHLKPREIQGCQLALDASIATSLYDATSGGNLVAADGAVARWEDQSGNGRHATQATSGARPLRRIGGVNGFDALEFDGTDDRLIFTLAGADPNAMIATCRWENTGQAGTRGIMAFGSVNDPAGGMILMQPTTGSQIGTFTGSFGYSTYTATSSPFSAALIDPGSGTCDFWVNGKSAGAGVSGNPVGQFQNHIGGATDSPVQYTNMRMSTAAIYSSALSAFVVKRATQSNMRKWRISG